MPTATMPQIKNVIFLMLENRSLDNVLGWLYRGGADQPKNVYPASSSPSFDGLATGTYTNPAYVLGGGVKNYRVVAVPDGSGDRVPAYDPYEELRIEGEWHGVMNQIFGTQDKITRLPTPDDPSRMLGFLQDYYARYMTQWQGLDILWAFTPAQLPTINALARQYAVSDRWFCSVPSQTNPNRAYSLCGTSLGRESNANPLADEHFDVTTIFNGLAAAGKRWGLYFTDVWKNGLSYTEYTFPWISKVRSSGEIGTIDQFFTRAAAGTLSDFTYLEPTWGYGKGPFYKQGTDLHPPTHVLPGDDFLGQVYRAIRSSPQWSQTLFIVTFDEHGGTYDHVAPPWGATNPDGLNGASGFAFNLFGARVPTILISPFVAPGTVFRSPGTTPFDHTSFIKTLLLWAGVDPASVNMGKRMPLAPSFDGVLSDQPLNDGIVPAGTPAEAKSSLGTVSSPFDLPDQPLNALFEGVSTLALRSILATCNDLAAIEAAVATYRSAPSSFEAALTPKPR